VWLDAQFASVPALMASLKVSTATHPYTPDAAALPIAFDGLNSNGTVYSGRTMCARFACGNAAVASVSCYVNGIRVAERVPVAGGEFSAVIPPGALTACDRILVLEDGELVGNGKHEELLATCPVYREIAAASGIDVSGVPAPADNSGTANSAAPALSGTFVPATEGGVR
jgi:hypothetical protein